MNERSPRECDAEDKFARDLERKHENLIAGSADHRKTDNPNPNQELDERVESAAKVLALLEELKPSAANVSIAAVETGDDHSTRKNADRTNDCERTAAVESTIPDLENLGRFKIIEQLGRGGFGIVVRAYDPELQRDVAIKIPRFEASMSPESKVRFDREAKAAASLNHPGIVVVHETGAVQGIDFIVSEFVDGENLGMALARGRTFSPIQSAEMVSQLADAIEHAHQRGVFHRDIKPSNILIDEKKKGVPKITDFGLASIIDEQDFTQTGAVVGTPAYMSPEQASGDKHAIGPHTDVYGLGTILYQLLTGQPPFAELPILETIRAIVDKDPVAPRSIDAALPKDIEAICLKCLEKDPRRRYGSAQLLQADLNRFLNNAPVLARRITRVDRVIRWGRRNPVLAMVSTALFLALSIGLVVALILWRTSEGHRQTAEQNQSKYQIKAEELEGIVDQMFERVREMPELGLKGMEPVREKMLADVNFYYTNLLAEAPTDPNLKRKRTETLLRMASIKSSLSDHHGAIEAATQLVDSIPTDAQSEQAQQRIDALVLMARSYSGLRQADKQKKCFDEALTSARNIYASISVPDDSDRIEFASSLSEAADILGTWGDRTLSTEMATESIKIWETVETDELTDETTILTLVRSYVIAATTHALSENREVARIYSKRAIDLVEQVLDESTASTPQAQFLLADACFYSGVSFRTEFANASPRLDKALLIASALASAHPLVPKYQRQISNINFERGLIHYVRYLDNELAADRNDWLQIALPIFESNIDFLNECLTQFHNEKSLFQGKLSSCITMKGILCGALEQYDGQLESFEQALALAKRTHDASGSPQDLIKVLGIHGNMADPYVKLEKYPEAIEKLEFANAGLLKILIDDPKNGTAARFLKVNYRNLAQSFSALDRKVDALNAYRKSIDYNWEREPESMMGMEAMYLVRVGEFGEAEAKFNRCVAHQIAQLDEADALPGIVLDASRIIKSIDELAPAAQSDVAMRLKNDVADIAVETLRSLDEGGKFSDAEITDFLNDPDLENFKATDAFQDWNNLRDR